MQIPSIQQNNNLNYARNSRPAFTNTRPNQDYSASQWLAIASLKNKNVENELKFMKLI